jgi:hypothetical protein
VVELEQMPQSGCARLQADLPLPAPFGSPERETQQEKTARFYFLACISMRRLLNRVHTLLYAPDVTAEQKLNLNLVSELAYQLEQWRDVLPTSLKFPLDNSELKNDHQAFLRQRYNACRSVIYRPLFNHVLVADIDGVPVLDSDIVVSATHCLEACYQHIANLRPYTHTVFIDGWICTVSMTSIMILLFVAASAPTLRPFLYNNIGIDNVKAAAKRMQSNIKAWNDSCPEKSPTLTKCIEMNGMLIDALE